MEELRVNETKELGVFEGSTSVPVIRMFNGEELSASKMINIVNGSAICFRLSESGIDIVRLWGGCP